MKRRIRRISGKRGAHRKCPTGKHRYPSQHAATQGLASARIRASLGHTNRQEDRSYECGRCGGWHLTSKPLWDDIE